MFEVAFQLDLELGGLLNNLRDATDEKSHNKAVDMIVGTVRLCQDALIGDHSVYVPWPQVDVNARCLGTRYVDPVQWFVVERRSRDLASAEPEVVIVYPTGHPNNPPPAASMAVAAAMAASLNDGAGLLGLSRR